MLARIVMVRVLMMLCWCRHDLHRRRLAMTPAGRHVLLPRALASNCKVRHGLSL